LRELICQRKDKEAKEYIDTIWKIQARHTQNVHTGDSFLEVVLNYYYDMAVKEKIEFTVAGRLLHLEFRSFLSNIETKYF